MLFTGQFFIELTTILGNATLYILYLGTLILFLFLHPGVNVIKLRISILWIFSPYFRKMENESLDKMQKYRENSRKTEIRIFITLAPGVNVI